jgi:GDPmannose 4,6-dehydratase
MNGQKLPTTIRLCITKSAKSMIDKPYFLFGKIALITGILGQDGRYLCDLLLSKGYRIIGTTHRSVPMEGSDLDPSIQIIQLDLSDRLSVENMLLQCRPDEIYHLASRSSSAQLFDDPWAIVDVNGLSCLRFLDVLSRHLRNTKFCHAGSSEIFAASQASPQNELTALCPANAYGAAKAYALHLVQAYRQQFGLKACTAILYNHESPRRAEQYVTRKISRAAAAISLGLQRELVLGDLHHRRDWGHAADTVRGMWLMLQNESPEDMILATGKTHSIRDFCHLAFQCVGLDYRDFVRSVIDPSRRPENIELCGDASKARTSIGWSPLIKFEDLIKEMVTADVALLKQI